MHLTIAICTWNRADSLSRTLSSLRNLELPESTEIHLVVVDNNCTDATPRIVADAQLPFLCTRVSETNSGLSHARNAAVVFARACNSDFIIFTDDDVEVERDWLAAYHAAFVSSAGVSVFGGPVTPVFAREPEPWMRRNMFAFRGPFVLVDHGEHDRMVGASHDMPFGANMAYRLAAMPTGQPFDVELGVAPGRRMGGEETDLSRRMLLERSEEWAYVSRARVRHHLPERIVSPDYLFMHLRSTGRLTALLAARHGPLPMRRPPLWLVRCYVTTWVLRRCCWLTRNFAGPYARHFSHEAMFRGQLDIYRAPNAAGEQYER